MAGNSVKYWSKSNVSNPVPSEDGNGFVPFEELGQTGTGFLSSSDAAMNGYLEAILGTYGIRALSKSDYEDSKKKTLSIGSRRTWREEIGGVNKVQDSVTPPAPPTPEQKAVTAANPKETVFSKTEGERTLPKNYKPKSGKRQNK
jgi:hypothetical protein